MQTTKVMCPLCHGVIAVAGEPPLGKSMHCQKCGAPFTVTVSDLCGLGATTSASVPALQKNLQANDVPWWVEAQQQVPGPVLQTPPKPAVAKHNNPPSTQQSLAILARAGSEASSLGHKDGQRVMLLGGVVVGLTLFLGVSAAVAVVCLATGTGKTQVAKSSESKNDLDSAPINGPSETEIEPQADPREPPFDPAQPGIPEQPAPPPPAEVKKQIEDPEPKLERTEPRRDAAPKPANPSVALRPARADKHGVTAAQQKNIDDAITGGARFLRMMQLNDGSWPPHADGRKMDAYPLGPTALASLTLLECGAAATDPQIVRAATFARTHWQNNRHTYEISLTLLFLDKLGDKKDKPIIQALALRLIRGQTQSGGWSYNCPILTNKEATQLLTALLRNRPKRPATAIDKGEKKPLANALDKGSKGQLPVPVDKDDQGPLPTPLPKKYKDPPPVSLNRSTAESIVFTLVGLQPPRGPKMQKLGFNPSMDDNSNTQFGMLGLWAARRHDVPVERVLALSELRFRASQLANGAWAYHLNRPDGKQSMTCVGLLGLALGKGSAAEIARRGSKLGDSKIIASLPADLQVRKGLNALNLRPYQLGTPDFRAAGGLYFVWSVERIGVLYDLTKIGNRDWYQWGVAMLLPTQGRNGNWENGTYIGSNAIHDSCFALLFLKRVNLAQDLTDLNLFMAIPDPNLVPPKDP